MFLCLATVGGGRVGSSVDAGGGGQWCKMPRRGECPQVVLCSQVGSKEPLIHNRNEWKG